MNPPTAAAIAVAMFVVPKRNIVQRAINRSVHRFGIKPFPVRFESSLPEAGQDPETVFNAVYAANYWDSEESRSGGGSELRIAERYIPRLVQAIRELNVRSMFDAPCGDLNWMPAVIDQTGIDYVGGDIAADALATARGRRPDLEVRHFDICSDEFPKADLWHCRDTFFHLSFAHIRQAIAKASAADITYAAITTHRSLLLKNLDIATGGFRLLDLEKDPFNFPKPICYLRDYPWGQFPRYVAIWRMNDLRGLG